MDAFTGNTLNLNSAATLFRVANFETINFTTATANITTLDTTPSGAAGKLVKLNTQGNNVTLSGTITESGGIEKPARESLPSPARTATPETPLSTRGRLSSPERSAAAPMPEPLPTTPRSSLIRPPPRPFPASSPAQAL
jgi:hypothetical protein